MGTATDETTVEIRTEDVSTGPMPMSEFKERADDAVRRLREAQLTFNVGQHNQPDHASVKVSGSLHVDADLLKQQTVRVAVTTTDGQVIAEGTATVTNIAFPDKTDKYGTTTERVHTVTLL